MPIDVVSELLAAAVPRMARLKTEIPLILGACRAGKYEYGEWGDYGYLQSAYPLAWLYTFKHPANPYYQQAWLADAAAEMTDHLPPLLAAGRARKENLENSVTAEWNPLAAVECIDLLKPDAKRRDHWMTFIDDYIQFAMHRPFGFTAPNHEAWRILFLQRAGTILGRPELSDRARFYLRQLLTYQTKEGFWEEGPHHGPSMTYNGLMLEPLAWVYRLTGDPAVRQAAERLADFMADWAMPDGCMVGAFDGRQSSGFVFGGPAVPGLELTARGRTLAARGLSFLHKGDWLGEGLRGSVWYDYFGMMFIGTALRYHQELVPTSEKATAAVDAVPPAAPLSADRDGTTENRSTEFCAMMFRRGAWCAALSGQNSQVTRQQSNIFRLERSSRIELWHADQHLVLGGGHNRNDAPAPYANAILDTGFAGNTEFGWLDAARHPKRRGYFMPHQTQLSRHADGIELGLIFSHGTVRFRLAVIDDKTTQIRASWDQQGVQRLCLQLPLVVWRGAELLADGAAVAPTVAPVGITSPQPAPVRQSLTARGGPFGKTVSLTVPDGVPAGVRWPLDTLQLYIEQAHIENNRKPLFRLAWVSSQWTNPAPTGTAEWTLTVR